ncbi:hypothetical protein ACOSQ2_015434 [Xanthoceras sorbifolium]
MSQRSSPSTNSDKDSRLLLSSEDSSLGASSSGTLGTEIWESASEPPSEFIIGYDFEEFYSRKLKHDRLAINHRALLKFSKGVPIPEAFLKVAPSKRARATSTPLMLLRHLDSDKGSSSGLVRLGKTTGVAAKGVEFRDPGEIPNTYAYGPLRRSAEGLERQAVFSPEESVDFKCFNARNFVRSFESIPRKMSTDNRIKY